MRRLVILLFCSILAGVATSPADAEIIQGFRLSGGNFTIFDAPGSASFTLATAINEADQVVGFYRDAQRVVHAYELSEGIFTSIDSPGATATFPFGINDSGQILGSFETPRVCCTATS